MKHLNLGSFGALALAPVLFYGVMQEPEVVGDDSGLKVEVQRQAVEIKALRVELDDIAGLMAETVKYQAAQSKAARSLVGVLSSSEDQGFTAGINPVSRETLLGGFRAYLGSQQTALPGAPPVAEAVAEAEDE